MKSNKIRSDLGVEYQNLLNLLARTSKYLEGLNVDPTLLKSYKQLLRYLRTRPAASIPEILGNATCRVEVVGKRDEQQLSDQEILAMTFEQILHLASNPKIPRRHLEKIASARFGVTKGGLSTLRSRDALVEKLRTLIGNEGAHDSITRMAGKQWPGR